MSHIMSKKPSAMQWWLLVLVLMLTGGVLVCGAALWQSRSKAEAQQTQQELELSAQRRRAAVPGKEEIECCMNIREWNF